MTAMVRATDPPSMDVEVGLEIVHIQPPPQDTIEFSSWSHAGPFRVVEQQMSPRVDLVCMTVESGRVLGRSVAGTPAEDPHPPMCPSGWVPLARVLVRPGVHAIHQADIVDIRP